MSYPEPEPVPEHEPELHMGMHMDMGTSISMSMSMSIDDWNIDELLPFVSYSADYSHGACTASDVPPYCRHLDGFPRLLYSTSLNLSLKLFLCVLILLDWTLCR